MLPRRIVWSVLVVGALLAATGCKRKHVAVDSVPELGYPTCPASDAAALSTRVAAGHIRSGPFMREQSVVERFEIDETGCHIVFKARQEWPRAVADVEVVYGPDLLPLRAWKRMTVPGSNRPDGLADIRRYELRTPEVTVKRRNPDGEILYEILKPGGKTKVLPGAKPMAVIGPGRGVISMWLRRAKLPVGGSVRELVLDFREAVELLEEATLKREEDRFEASLGRNVRVYTFYGRESVFADENDLVIGDLAGMRPSDSVEAPEPPPLPMYGEPDPVNTP